MRKFKIIAAGVAILLLQGCATVELPPMRDSSAESLDNVLSREFPSRTTSADATAQAAQLTGHINIHNYAGEAKNILRKIALAHNLKFNIRGLHPHMQLFVMVDAKGATLEEVLKDIGAQTAQRANVVLTSTSIEVHYRDK